MRRRFLNQFADREGKEFLAHFYRKYRGTPEELLPALISDLRPLPSRLAAAFLGVEPQADFAAFSAFMASQLGDRVGGEAQLRAPLRHLCAASAEPFRPGLPGPVHPLELWLVGYLKQHPGSQFRPGGRGQRQQRETYRWLLNSRFRHAQDVRIKIALEAEAFRRITAAWRRSAIPSNGWCRPTTPPRSAAPPTGRLPSPN